MSQDVYKTPASDLGAPVKVEVPVEILKKIKTGWVAGVVSVCITVVFTLIALSGTDILGGGAVAFIDAGLMAALAFGTYKKSRICAVLMLLLFVANKVLMWMDEGVPSGIVLALVFVWCFVQGAIGTFQYHAFLKSAAKTVD